MRPAGLLALALLSLAFGPVHAKEPDAPGCRDPGLLTRFPGFRISRCTNHDFSTHTFLAGNKETAVEGRYTEIMYALDEGAKAPGAVAVHRNIQNALVKVGGVQVGNNGEGDQYYQVVKDGAEVEAGQPLIEMDPVYAEQDTKAAQLEVTRLEQQLERVSAT